MTDFFQDLWHELREKRLWPVAALLVLGIVAIPAVLTKSAAEPAPTAAAIDAGEQPSDTGVVLDTASASASGTGSSLDTFSSQDPFAPPKSVTKKAEAAAAADAGSTEAGGKSAGGGAPAPDSGGGSAPDAPAPPTLREKITQYEYVAAVTFWSGDRRRKIDDLRKLEMLPSDSAPALIFMGVAQDGGNAVFLVDSTLSTTGEGSCSPSRANCAYVSLGPGSEQAFTSEDGRSYRLRVDEIRRVKVTAGSARLAPRASTAMGSAEPARRFSLPALIDLVVTTSQVAAEESAAETSQTDSSNQNGGR
jgi:hypothetical protein